MKVFKKYLFIALAVLMSTTVLGQNVEMADTFRSEGKIYVVVAIILVILAGFILYLFRIDRRLSKMEKRIGDKGQTKS